MTVRNYQLAQFTFHSPSNQGMCGEVVNGGLDCRHGACGRRGGFIAQKRKGTFDVIERARRINYLRHGFGRAAVSSCARRPIQACTSSAR